jgi:hypothetical protein
MELCPLESREAPQVTVVLLFRSQGRTLFCFSLKVRTNTEEKCDLNVFGKVFKINKEIEI